MTRRSADHARAETPRRDAREPAAAQLARPLPDADHDATAPSAGRPLPGPGPAVPDDGRGQVGGAPGEEPGRPLRRRRRWLGGRGPPRAARANHPGWYHNIVAHPDQVEAEVSGRPAGSRWTSSRARPATAPGLRSSRRSRGSGRTPRRRTGFCRCSASRRWTDFRGTIEPAKARQLSGQRSGSVWPAGFVMSGSSGRWHGAGDRRPAGSVRGRRGRAAAGGAPRTTSSLRARALPAARVTPSVPCPVLTKALVVPGRRPMAGRPSGGHRAHAGAAAAAGPPAAPSRAGRRRVRAGSRGDPQVVDLLVEPGELHRAGEPEPVGEGRDGDLRVRQVGRASQRHRRDVDAVALAGAVPGAGARTPRRAVRSRRRPPARRRRPRGSRSRWPRTYNRRSPLGPVGARHRRRARSRRRARPVRGGACAGPPTRARGSR